MRGALGDLAAQHGEPGRLQLQIGSLIWCAGGSPGPSRTALRGHRKPWGNLKLASGREVRPGAVHYDPGSHKSQQFQRDGHTFCVLLLRTAGAAAAGAL